MREKINRLLAAYASVELNGESEDTFRIAVLIIVNGGDPTDLLPDAIKAAMEIKPKPLPVRKTLIKDITEATHLATYGPLRETVQTAIDFTLEVASYRIQYPQGYSLTAVGRALTSLWEMLRARFISVPITSDEEREFQEIVEKLRKHSAELVGLPTTSGEFEGARAKVISIQEYLNRR